VERFVVAETGSIDVLNACVFLVEVVEALVLLLGLVVSLSMHDTSDYPIVHTFVVALSDGLIIQKGLFRIGSADVNDWNGSALRSGHSSGRGLRVRG